MLYINDWSINMLKKKFSAYAINAKCPLGSWQTSRYIQLYLKRYDHDIHYEYRIDSNWDGRVELHFEGDWENNYGVLIDRLMNNTQNCDEITWSEWDYGYRCQHSKKINSIEDLYQTLSYMMELFDKLINVLTSEIPSFEEQEILSDGTLPQQDGAVDIFEKRYIDILHLPLSIPSMGHRTKRI